MDEVSRKYTFDIKTCEVKTMMTSCDGDDVITLEGSQKCSVKLVNIKLFCKRASVLTDQHSVLKMKSLVCVYALTVCSETEQS